MSLTESCSAPTPRGTRVTPDWGRMAAGPAAPAGWRRRLLSGRAHFAVACCLFAFAAWRILGAGIDRLLLLVPDDAFYYLQIARNLVDLGRSTFDGTSVTNGYHPLWMAVLTGLAVAFHDKGALLVAALSVSLALQVAIALLLRRAVAGLVSPDWAWTAAACWLINPLSCLIVVQGTEAALYGVCALAVFARHRRLAASDDNRFGSFPAVLAYGAALGLLCLARTSGVVVAVVALAWLGLAARKRGFGTSGAALRVFAAGTLVALVLAPWWLFSIAEVGTIAQDSGVMKMLRASALYPGLLGRAQNLGDTVSYFARVATPLPTSGSTAGRIAGAICLGAAPLFVLVRRRQTPHAGAIRAAVVPVCALAFVYGTLLGERQLWWLMLPCLAAFLAFFIGLPAVLDDWRLGTARQGAVRSALLLLVVCAFALWHARERALYPWQPDVRRSQAAIEARLPEGARVGCFNAGIPGYFGAGRVVALDGLVNHEVVAYWQARRLDSYLRERHIVLIADEERTLRLLTEFSQAPIVADEVAAYALRGSATKRVLWRMDVAPSGH